MVRDNAKYNITSSDCFAFKKVYAKLEFASVYGGILMSDCIKMFEVITSINNPIDCDNATPYLIYKHMKNVINDVSEFTGIKPEIVDKFVELFLDNFVYDNKIPPPKPCFGTRAEKYIVDRTNR